MSIFNLPAVLICGHLAMIAAADGQIRTVTQQPYPTGGNSVAWIRDIPYVEGAARNSNSIFIFRPNRRICRSSYSSTAADLNMEISLATV